MYGLNHAQRRRHLITEFSHILGRCTTALMYAPHDEELLDVQCQLQDIIRYLTSQSYQSAELRQLQDGIIENQSQSHSFFRKYTHRMLDIMRYKLNMVWTLLLILSRLLEFVSSILRTLLDLN